MCGNHRSSCVCPASRGRRLHLRQRSRCGDRLYATDFHNGRVDVFDGSFKPVLTPGAFVDRNVAARVRALLPAGKESTRVGVGQR